MSRARPFSALRAALSAACLLAPAAAGEPGDAANDALERWTAEDGGTWSLWRPAGQERVTLLGPVPQDELKSYYSCADALVLASSREGLANVLLESMACGTPVIASNVWGAPEVVCAPEAGLLMDERTPAGLVRAVQRLRAAYPERARVRRYAEGFSWDATTRGQLEVFAGAVS